MSYPKISDPNFNKKINKIYDKYTIPKKKKTFNQICFPKSYELQMPQKFVSQYINPKTPYKGVLVYHRIGAGKTCTAVRIGEEWKNHRKIVVVVPASLKGNFRNELRTQCAGNAYLTNDERKKLSEHHPSDKEYMNIIKKSDERIDKHYKIYSYNKFIELASEDEISLNNSVLIVDEIQNMISEGGRYYDILYDLITNAPPSLRVVLLSATPMFDKPNELALTMNLLRIPKELPVGKEFDKTFIKMKRGTSDKISLSIQNGDLFKQHVKGYISYFRGAPSYVFPEMTIKYVKCVMSSFQYNAYKSVLKNEMADVGNMRTQNKMDKSVDELPNNFYIGTRFISNVVFPNKQIGDAGLESFKSKHIINNLDKYSIKISKIIKKVNSCRGKVFIYSNFKEHGGIKSIIRVLDEFGYKNYMKHGEGKKRYAIWSGEESTSVKEQIKAIYNMNENLECGNKIKILLGSPSIKEGVSLAGVQQVHILEPYWNQAKMDQIIGRASRYCSHKNMEEERRKVKVYVYLATHPDEEETVDQYILSLAEKKNKIIREFEKLIKEVAVDCTLNKSLNKDGDDDFKCDA